MAPGGRPPVAPVVRSAARRFLFRACLALGLVVGLIEASAITRDFARGDITDPWLALFPLLWIDLALLVVLLLSLGFLTQTKSEGGTAHGWWARMVPRFETLAAALRPGPLRARILLIGIAYAIILSFLQGIIVVDPSGALLPDGTAYPVLDVTGGPIGWGPKLVWAPDPFFGVLLRPYTVAATALLGTLVAGGAAAGVAVGSLVAVSTVMLFVSVTAMWIGIARITQTITIPTDERQSIFEARSQRIGNLLVAMALLFAVGSLVVDLSAAPSALGHGETGVNAAHPVAALVIGASSTALALEAFAIFRS